MNPRKLQTLTTILEEFSASPVPSHIFQVIADFAPALLSHHFLGICLMEEGQQFRIHTLSGQPSHSGELFKVEDGPCGLCLSSSKSFRGAIDSAIGNEPFWGNSSLQCALVSPIRQGESVSGALAFGHEKADGFDEDDEVLAEALAAALSASLQNSKLYQELSDERLTLRAVLQASTDAFLLVNPEGVLLMANDAAEIILNRPASEAPGLPLRSLTDNDAIHSIFDNPQTYPVEVEISNQRTAQVTVSPVNTEFGETVGYSASFRDITSLKELNEMKSEFVHSVSHDLKGPIGSLMLGIELLERGNNLEPKQKKQLARMMRTMDDMKLLVENLLDLGRLEAGRGGKTEVFDLLEVASASINSFMDQYADRKIHLSHPKGSSLPVEGDRNQILQVINNLLGNAIKYSPDGGPVQLAMSRQSGAELAQSLDVASEDIADTVLVRVSDKGIGISEEESEKVYDRFFRSDNPEGREISGTGLGLAIVKKAVETHGGAMHMESTLGEGSTFSFFLPTSYSKTASS